MFDFNNNKFDAVDNNQHPLSTIDNAYQHVICVNKSFDSGVKQVDECKKLIEIYEKKTKENLKSWFDAGAYCVGMGSKLITKDIVAAGDWSALSAKVKEVLATIKSIRQT